MKPAWLEKSKLGGEWYVRAVVEGLDITIELENYDFIKEMQIKR